MNKNGRTAHWVGHSLLKELDYNDFFERKMIIQDLEDNLTRAPIYASNTDYSAVAEEENAYEAITKADKYRNNMDIDI